MKKEQKILSNKCPCCNKVRFYKTKCGFDRANKKGLYCKSCINSIIQGGTGSVIKNEKRKCSNCKEYKTLENYFELKAGGFHSACLVCSKKLSKDYHKNTYRFNKYNIDKSYYDNLVEKQENKCKICLNVTIKFHIDHCHKNGHVRGLLCSKCNKALGLVNDNINILENAIKYLKNNE